jgi:hypothetical protein
MLLMPTLIRAASNDCTVVELPDHYELICEGDGKTLPGQNKTPVSPELSPVEQVPVIMNPSVRSLPADPFQDGSLSNIPLSGATSQAPFSGTRQFNRQGRPSSIDMNAAIEARKKLIQELRPKE